MGMGFPLEVIKIFWNQIVVMVAQQYNVLNAASSKLYVMCILLQYFQKC